MSKFDLPLKDPKPDFEELKKVIRKEKNAEKVHFVELLMDKEIIDAVLENYLHIKPVKNPEDDYEEYWKQQVLFWYKMGYDYMWVTNAITIPKFSERITNDTAQLSRGKRNWVEEGTGSITNWKDFEEYPWEKMEKFDLSSYEIISKNLPDGMKMMVCPSSGVFEIVSERLLGFEGMSMMLFDDPELLKAVFDKVGGILQKFYLNICDMDNLGGFFQGDDLGFKTATFLSPKHTKEYVLSWHKKFAQIAHENDLLYWIHACGNLKEIYDDIIDYVKVDAFHSFQDIIMPVIDFKRVYGDRVTVLGGVDIDNLARMEPEKLSKYVRNILDNCMPSGYALGSGNTVANYIPVENYLTMLQEGINWGK